MNGLFFTAHYWSIKKCISRKESLTEIRMTRRTETLWPAAVVTMFEAWEGIKARTYSVPQTCMELVELANSVRQQDPNIYSDTGRGPLSIKARTYSVPRTLHNQHTGWVFLASALKDFIIMGIQLGYYGAAEISFFLSSLFVHDTKKDLEISFPEQVLKKTKKSNIGPFYRRIIPSTDSVCPSPLSQSIKVVWKGL